MDAALVFAGITPVRFTAISVKAEAAAGIAISGWEGTASRGTPFGEIEIMWNYNAETETLTLQCMKRPWGFGGKIESGLRQLVEETNG